MSIYSIGKPGSCPSDHCLHARSSERKEGMEARGHAVLLLFFTNSIAVRMCS